MSSLTDTKHKEKRFIVTIFLLLVLSFVLSVGCPTISTFFAKPVSIQAVTVFPSGETITTERLMLPSSSVSEIFQTKFIDFFNYHLPLTLLGKYLFPTSLIAIPNTAPELLVSHFLPQLFFWILSLVSLPFSIKYSKNLPKWRRIIYIFLITVLLSGMGAGYWFIAGD